MFPIPIKTACCRYQIDREMLYDLVDQGEVRLYLRDRDGDLACDGCYEPAGAGLVVLPADRADVYVTLFFDGQDMTDPITLAPYNGRPLPAESELWVLSSEIEAVLQPDSPDEITTEQNTRRADEAAVILEKSTQRSDDWSKIVDLAIVESIRRTGGIPEDPGDVLQNLPDDMRPAKIPRKGSQTPFSHPDVSKTLSQKAMCKRLASRRKKLAGPADS